MQGAQNNLNAEKIVMILLFSFAVADIGSFLLNTKHIEPVSNIQNPVKDDHSHDNNIHNHDHQSQEHSVSEKEHPKSYSGVKITSGEDEIQTQMDFTSDKTGAGMHPTRELMIRYCSSSNKASFDQISNYLSQNHPNIIVNGDQYPLPPTKMILSKLITYVQYGIMIFMVAGDWVFTKLGITPPPIYYRLKEKQFVVIMGIMFIGNNISSMLTSTGAFEVYLDNNLIFSQLASGKIPTTQEIENALL